MPRAKITPEAATLVAAPNFVIVSSVTGGPTTGPYQCSAADCELWLSIPLGDFESYRYAGLKVKSVWQDEVTIFFCDRSHFAPYAAAARSGDWRTLTTLKRVGHVFRDATIIYKGESQMPDQNKSQGAQLVPEASKKPQGAELAPATTERTLWQRPPMLIAASVLALLVTVFVIFGASGGGANVSATPTLAPAQGQATSAPTAAGKAKTISTPVPTAVVPGLVRITDDCNGKVPAGVAVWFWTVNGMVSPELKFDGTETMNGMGLKKGTVTFCSVAKRGYSWAFYKK